MAVLLGDRDREKWSEGRMHTARFREVLDKTYSRVHTASDSGKCSPVSMKTNP